MSAQTAHGYLFRRAGRELVPASKNAADALGAVAEGERVWIHIDKERSGRQHRLFRALLQKVAEATEFHTGDALLAHLKIRLGKFVPVKIAGHQQPIAVLRSTSFADMKQAEFQKFFDDCLFVIVTEILGVSKDDGEGVERTKRELLAEVEAMLSPVMPA